MNVTFPVGVQLAALSHSLLNAASQSLGVALELSLLQANVDETRPARIMRPPTNNALFMRFPSKLAVTILEQAPRSFWDGTQNQEVGPQRALRGPVAAEDSVLR